MGSPATVRRYNHEDRLMRIYIIGNDGITLSLNLANTAKVV